MTNTTYRKPRGGGSWHCCMNCEEWPGKDFEELSSSTYPPAADLCPRCASLQENGRCQRSDEIAP